MMMEFTNLFNIRELFHKYYLFFRPFIFDIDFQNLDAKRFLIILKLFHKTLKCFLPLK